MPDNTVTARNENQDHFQKAFLNGNHLMTIH